MIVVMSALSVCVVSRVYSCLLSLVGDRQMTDDCREKLMEVQYFVTRNFQ